MRVLLLTSRFPYPPHRGDRVLAHQLVRELAARGHRVTLVSFMDGHEPAESVEAMGPYCERIETVRLAQWRSWMQAWLGLLSRHPSQVSYYRSTAMKRCLDAVWGAGPFDVVLVQMFRAAAFVRDLRHPAKILFLTDSLGLSLQRSLRYASWWKRLPLWWELRRVARYEVAITRAFRRAWVLSEVDAADLRSRGCDNVAVVPYGVDERLFTLARAHPLDSRVLFLGNMSVPHNRDAAVYLARDIWPRVRRAVPEATLDLVGADPAPAVLELGALPGVTVTGAVDDLGPVWRRSAVMVAPLRFSAGVQTKVLEAMAAGVPTVTTPQVAEVFGARNGENLRIGEDAESLANAVIEILRDPSASLPMTERARTRVREQNSWDTVIRQLEREAAEARASS